MPGQAHRIIYMYRKFLEGEVLTSMQLQDMISEEIEIVSIRTIQRDLRLLQKIEPSLVGKAKGKEIIWSIPKEFRIPKQIVRFETDELLAFHFLKAHLKTFRGTIIEEDAKKLYKKLEKLAPQEVVLDETIYWDQNVGYYDYSKINNIVADVIRATASKNWYSVTYSAPKNAQSKEFIVRFETIFSYLGMLYVVAYMPKHKIHASLAVHNILNIEEAKDFLGVAPPFNFREWSIYRFGVFSGEIHNVKLLIKSEFKHFFLNRKWHVTQIEKIDSDGNMILEMKVPVGVDLINWILSWSDAIIVLEPQELVKKVINRLHQALSSYDYVVDQGGTLVPTPKQSKEHTAAPSTNSEQSSPAEEKITDEQTKPLYRFSLKKKK